MYTDFHLTKDRPAYLQIKEYLRRLISTGMLREGQKLPSTRELSCILRVSRNTVLEAYRCLIDEGFAGASGGRGTYITAKTAQADGRSVICTIKWPELITGEARKAEELDIVKHRLPYKKGMIAFTSIAPDESFLIWKALNGLF
jgi:DNA-binding transcriptional regulator YhcF (GntR family)